MTEDGIVTKIKGNKAWVLVNRSTMCEGCHSEGACHSLGGGKDMEAEAINSAGGKVGDRVRLKISGSALLKIAFLVYMIPVITLIGGALAGMRLAPTYGYDPETSALILGTCSFVATLLLIYAFGKRATEDIKYMPEVTKILLSNVNVESCDT